MPSDLRSLKEVVTVVIGVVIVALYVVLSVIAFRRRYPDRPLVLTINPVFGSTFIDWAVALQLATRSSPARDLPRSATPPRSATRSAQVREPPRSA